MRRQINSKIYNPKNFSVPYATSTGVLSGEGIFYGIIIKTDGTNDMTLSVYDSLSAAGTKLLPESTVINGSSRGVTIIDDAGLPVYTGIYVSIACAGTYSYQVYYDN